LEEIKDKKRMNVKTEKPVRRKSWREREIKMISDKKIRTEFFI